MYDYIINVTYEGRHFARITTNGSFSSEELALQWYEKVALQFDKEVYALTLMKWSRPSGTVLARSRPTESR